MDGPTPGWLASEPGASTSDRTPTSPDGREAGPVLRLTSIDDDATAADPAERERRAGEMLAAARRVLAGLKVDRSRLEARLAERGIDDPIQLVRGRSAIDDAISRTQAMIAEMDGLLDEADRI